MTGFFIYYTNLLWIYVCLSIFIKNTKISHQLSLLLLISILSCIVILIVNHILIDKYYIKNNIKNTKQLTTLFKMLNRS